MELTTLSLLLLASYGLAFGVMNEKVPFLAQLLRAIPLGKDEEGATIGARMLVCPYCTGFHTGWITWLVWAFASQTFDATPAFAAGTVLFGFASSAVSYTLDTIIQWFER